MFPENLNVFQDKFEGNILFDIRGKQNSPVPQETSHKAICYIAKQKQKQKQILKNAPRLFQRQHHATSD